MGEWNKVFITPQKFHNDIITLCNMIPKNKYKFVWGIPRGGSIIAVYISHYCEGIDYLESGEGVIVDLIPETLIVDDLTDTGATLKDFAEVEVTSTGELIVQDTAVLYYKLRSTFKPTYFVEQSPNDQWIVFPYEKPDEEPNREI